MLMAPPPEANHRLPEERIDLSTRLIIAGRHVHDADRLACTAIADVRAAGEDPQWPGYELRDLGIAAMAEGAAHRSSQHVHTPPFESDSLSNHRERTTMRAMASLNPSVDSRHSPRPGRAKPLRASGQPASQVSCGEATSRSPGFYRCESQLEPRESLQACRASAGARCLVRHDCDGVHPAWSGGRPGQRSLSGRPCGCEQSRRADRRCCGPLATSRSSVRRRR